MPIFALPGEITPGQFGPISRDFDVLHDLPHLHHVQRRNALGDADDQRNPRSPSASRMPSAANGGGTKIIVAFAPVSFTASSTVLNTGQPSCVVPPLPGVTPPTTFVPYSAQPLA